MKGRWWTVVAQALVEGMHPTIFDGVAMEDRKTRREFR
jgi:hypothetical protein